MKTNITGHTRGRRAFLAVLVAMGLALVLLCALAVLSFLRLGSDTRALRNAVLSAAETQARQKVAVNVGWFTTAAARLGSRCFSLPREPRAAIDSLRGAEVGVYELEQPARAFQTLLAAADKAMTRRGWERAVGVVRDGEMVGVYLPRSGVSADRVKCCVVVLHERELVVVSARGNPQPLLALAREQVRTRAAGVL